MEHDVCPLEGREHEDIDVLVEDDLATIAALKQCGLWKFF
jgi:hypothetical protein